MHGAIVNHDVTSYLLYYIRLMKEGGYAMFNHLGQYHLVVMLITFQYEKKTLELHKH